MGYNHIKQKEEFSFSTTSHLFYLITTGTGSLSSWRESRKDFLVVCWPLKILETTIKGTAHHRLTTRQTGKRRNQTFSIPCSLLCPWAPQGTHFLHFCFNWKFAVMAFIGAKEKLGIDCLSLFNYWLKTTCPALIDSQWAFKILQAFYAYGWLWSGHLKADQKHQLKKLITYLPKMNTISTHVLRTLLSKDTFLPRLQPGSPSPCHITDFIFLHYDFTLERNYKMPTHQVSLDWRLSLNQTKLRRRNQENSLRITWNRHHNISLLPSWPLLNSYSMSVGSSFTPRSNLCG